MKKGLISVVIPCYNCAKYLDDTIKCLNEQTYKNFEAIFVNDGSTDSTLEKLKTLCNGKKQFKVLSKENGGASSARNLGLANADGEFVLFYDVDDLLSPNHLELLANNIEDYDCLVTSSRTIDDDTRYDDIKKFETFDKTEIFNGSDELICQMLITKKFITGFWNKFLRHSLLKKFKNYPNVFDVNVHYAEDALFGVEYFLQCKNAKYINLKSYYYRNHPGSLSKAFSKRMLSVTNSFDKYIELCKDQPLALQYVKSFICMLCIEFLFRIRLNKYYDKKTIDFFFETLKNYKKDLKKCKKAAFYYRFLTPCTIWVLKILFIGKVKNEQSNKEN